jgi:hypothetical protein
MFESSRARQQNQRLGQIVRKRVKAKLTTNSPTEHAFWRIIGGDLVALLPWNSGQAATG